MACEAQHGCVQALDCLGDCGTTLCGLDCSAPAAPPFKGVIDQLAICGATNGCFAEGSGIETCGGIVRWIFDQFFSPTSCLTFQ